MERELASEHSRIGDQQQI